MAAAAVGFCALEWWLLRNLSDGTVQVEKMQRGLSFWPNWSTQWRPNSLTNLTRRDNQLERWLDGPLDPAWWQRIQRWRLGNPPRFLDFHDADAIHLRVHHRSDEAHATTLTALPNQFSLAPLRGVVMFGIAQPLLIGGWMLAARWRLRAKLLALEAIGPGWDRTFRVRWPRRFLSTSRPPRWFLPWPKGAGLESSGGDADRLVGRATNFSDLVRVWLLAVGFMGRLSGGRAPGLAGHRAVRAD